MRRSIAAALALGAMTAFAAGTDSGVKQLGQWVMQYKDDAVQVVLGTRHASQHLDRDWMLLEVNFSANGPAPIEVMREDVALVMPGGLRVPLATQKQMSEGLKDPDASAVFREGSITRDPLDGYFVGRYRVQRLGFFEIPNTIIVHDLATVDREMIAMGYIFFQSPKGSWPEGRYKLEIFNKWVDVKLPFDLPGQPPKKKGDPNAVPW